MNIVHVLVAVAAYHVLNMISMVGMDILYNLFKWNCQVVP